MVNLKLMILPMKRVMKKNVGIDPILFCLKLYWIVLDTSNKYWSQKAVGSENLKQHEENSNLIGTQSIAFFFLWHNIVNILLAALLFNCLPFIYAPYFDNSMFEKEVEEFMISFISDKAISFATCFNLS